MDREPLGPPGVRPPGGWNARFDAVPEEYDVLRAGGHMSRRRLEVFAALVGPTSGLVLELGSGTGTLLRGLAARFPERRFLGMPFDVGRGESVGSVVKGGVAGVVLSVDALHHVSDLDATVAETAEAAAPGAHWFAMEPDRLHPYVLAYHVLTPGERTFPPGDFLRRAARAGWELACRRRLFLYPSGVRRVPGWASALERRLERVPLLGGGILLDLVRRRGAWTP